MDFNTGSAQGTGHEGEVFRGSEFRRGDPVNSFVEAVRGVVAHPVGFYSSIARSGDYINPLIFALIAYEVSAVLGGIIAIILGNSGVGGFIATIIIAPIIAAAGLFIGAGILHLLVMLLVGAHSGYEATFRTLAYSSVTSLVSWIPFIGPVLGLYSIVLSVIGIREMHRTTTGRALAVVLIPAAVVFVLVAIVAIIVGVAFLSAISQ